MNDEVSNYDTDVDDLVKKLKVEEEDDDEYEKLPEQAKAPDNVYTRRSGRYVIMPEIYTHYLGVLDLTESEFG